MPVYDENGFLRETGENRDRRSFGTSALLGGDTHCACVLNLFEQDCAFPDCLGGELMSRAPKDGSEIEILFQHENYTHASPRDRYLWREWCRARWTDFNGGGWVWHGLAGTAMCWRPVPHNTRSSDA